MRLGVNGRFLAAGATGVQRFALEVLRRLIPREEVTLFVPDGVALPAGLPAPHRVVAGRLRGPAWEQVELPASAARAPVDVLLHPASAAPLGGVPNVVVLHDVLPLARPAGFRLAYRAWVRLAHVAAARRAAALATVSEWSAGEIARLAGIPRERIAVVAQGAAPLDAPASPGAVEEVRRRHGLAGPYFLAVTGADPRKGESLLRQAWRRFPTGRAPALAVVGERSGRVHRAGRHPPAPDVRALGRVSDEELRGLYTGAVALLFPSEAEGFGRPPLEALACGTRVAVAPYGAAPEVVGDAAERVAPDPDAWREAAVRLLAEEPAERARRVEVGRRRAAAHRWDDGVSALVGLCRAAARGER